MEDTLPLSNLFLWVSIGLIVGFGVYLIDRRYSHDGVFGTVVSGMLGALLGGFLANLIFKVGIGALDFTTALIVLAGALLLSVIPRLISYQEKDDRMIQKYDFEQGGILGKNIGQKKLVYYSQVTPLKESKKTFKKTPDDVMEIKKLDVLLNKTEFPVSKRDLVSFAEHSEIDTEVLNTLEGLPDHIYENKDDVVRQIKRKKH